MPDYFWIPFTGGILLVVGFASGYWISRQGKLVELEEIRYWLGKLAGNAEQVEKLLLPRTTKLQVERVTYTSSVASKDGLVSEIQNINDQLNRIGRKLTRQDAEGVIGNQRAGDEDQSREGESDQEYVQEHLEQALLATLNVQEDYTARDTSHGQEPYARIIQLYNLGIDDRTTRDTFRSEYTITRIGNNKAVEQRLGEVATPEFRKLDNGNFLAVPGEQGLFYVLPWFDSTLNSSAYNEGGFGHVFACPGYDPETAYTVVRVKRPAVFRQDGDAWVRVEKGELILQR